MPEKCSCSPQPWIRCKQLTQGWWPSQTSAAASCCSERCVPPPPPLPPPLLPPLPPPVELASCQLHVNHTAHCYLALQGVNPDAISAEEAAPAGDGKSWGFPTNLPPRHRLVEYLQQQQAAAAAEQQAAQWLARQHGMPDAAADAEAAAQQQQAAAAQPGWPAQAPPQRPLLLELLQQSRTFQSPHCAGGWGGTGGIREEGAQGVVQHKRQH